MTRELAEMLFTAAILGLPIATVTGIAFGVVVSLARKLSGEPLELPAARAKSAA